MAPLPSVLGVARNRLGRVAPFRSLRGYKSAWIPRDATAAVALLAIAVPEQLATARLAGTPPITGLYAFIAATVLFALWGANRQMSVGADSTIAPLFAGALAAIGTTGSPHYIALVALVAVIAGALVALVGLLRAGWIAEFLSAPLISGFMAGIAVIIVVHQLPDLLGIDPTGGDTIVRLEAVTRGIADTNGPTLCLGIGVIIVVVAAERIGRHVPGPLIGLIAATAAAAVFNLSDRGVVVLGPLANDAPQLGLSEVDWSSIRTATPIACVVALVVITQTAATTRAFADPDPAAESVNRDFVGVGAGSIASGLVGAFAVNASPPRTAAIVAAGGRTQLAGLAAAVGVAALIPAAAILHDVPVVALAAILMTVAGRLFPIRDLIGIARYNRFEFALAMITMLAVALIGVEQGIAVAVTLAILDRTRISAHPQLHVLGRIPGTTSWIPRSASESTEQVGGLLVTLFATPIWYANADHFRAALIAAVDRAQPRLVILDTVGMSDIDYTGSRALGAVLDHLDTAGIEFAMARVSNTVRAGLAHSGLRDRIGADHLFDSVGSAVAALAPVSGCDELGKS